MNIHLLPDSPYANWYVKNCMSCNSGTSNRFYCISGWNQPAYIDKSLVSVIEPGTEAYREMIREMNNASERGTIYAHFLDYPKACVINAVHNKNINVVWVVWSEDFYRLPKLKFNKYDAYSLKFTNAAEKPKGKPTIKERLGRLKMQWIDGIVLDEEKRWSLVYKAIRKVDYCATLMETEVEIIRDNLNPHVKWLPYAIISATNGIDMAGAADTPKEFVQIGNSADPSNNHYEVLTAISDRSLIEKPMNIVLPLAYGNAAYTEKLIKDIEPLFGPEDLIVMREFMAVEDYYALLKKVRVAIFPHNIQQAFGNIIALLAFGAKVFLKRDNPLYKQFRKWGVEVFSIEEQLTAVNLSVMLGPEQIRRNQEIISELVSPEKINEYYFSLLRLEDNGK